MPPSAAPTAQTVPHRTQPTITGPYNQTSQVPRERKVPKGTFCASADVAPATILVTANASALAAPMRITLGKPCHDTQAPAAAKNFASPSPTPPAASQPVAESDQPEYHETGNGADRMFVQRGALDVAATASPPASSGNVSTSGSSK